jgi:hypothetical protein
MSKHGIVRNLFSAVALTAIMLGGSVLGALVSGGVAAWADEPPPDDFPPPSTPKDAPPADGEKADVEKPAEKAPEGKAPAPSLPPAELPKAKPPVAPKPPALKPAEAGAWSPPAVVPGGTGSALPAPQIIRRRGGTAAPSAMPRAPTAPRMTRTEPPIVDMPTTRPPPPPLLPAPRGPSATGPVVRTPALPTAPRAFPTVVTSTRVFSVAKTHNVALAAGDLALQMDVDYEVHGQDGRNVYVGIWFVRRDTGAHIRSALTTYADSDGFVTLQTRTALVRGNTGRFTATLRIPYRAFPVAQSSESYEVEARVQILRADGAGRTTSLARGTTTFRVYGSSDAETPSNP